jgi:hypothetical protein
MWGALCHERTGLSFTTAAGPRQRNHSQVWDPPGPWPYFSVSDLILPQPGGPGHRMYISQEQSGPVIPPGTGFPFSRVLRLAGLWWRYSNPPPRGEIIDYFPSTYLVRHGPHWKHRIQQLFSFCVCIGCREKVFIEPLPSNNHILCFHYSGFQALEGTHTHLISALFIYFFKLRKEESGLKSNEKCVGRLPVYTGNVKCEWRAIIFL